jgi:FkbM family methyltransferase
MFRAALATRRAFHNWIEVGFWGGMAVESQIPPRHGWARAGKHRLQFETRLGPTLETDAANASAVVEVFRNGEYDVPIDWPNLTLIIDVGAHVGAFLCWSAQLSRNARILAFEPEPLNFADLERNVKLNGLEDRVTLHNAAIAAQEGNRLLNVPPERNLASFALPIPGAEVVSVPTVGLDGYIRKCSERVSLLKMDCEGAEWEVVPSLTDEAWGKIERVLIECHSLNLHRVADMRATLNDAGFRHQTVTKETSGPAALGVLTNIVASREAP